ncbi:MAG: glycosyltransferase family 2 protein [Candidatus Eremiobacteraeota bacterium]|nr:glycosyltransferase family 2 protein [Candidatus Eremiobacteraeota bacterium]
MIACMMPVTSVVVPAFNEARGLRGRLERLTAHLRARYADRFEIVVVNDGSSDATAEVLTAASEAIPQLRVVTHRVNQGLDASVRDGILAARGECVVTLDADLTYAPETIDSLLEALQAGAEIAVSSPYMKGGSSVGVPWWRWCLSRAANSYLSLAVPGKLATWTSMVRAYRSQIALVLIEDGAFVDATYGVLLNAHRSGWRIAEVPAVLDWSHQPKSRARRVNVRRTLTNIVRVLVAGARVRPALLLSIPGLIPGLLPAVTGLGFLLHLAPTTLGVLSLWTAVVQYASLAFTAKAISGAITCKQSTSQPSNSPAIKIVPVEISEAKSLTPLPKFSLLGR